MSDDDETYAGGSGGGPPGGDEELTLPRATVHKLMTQMVPQDVACAKEARDVLIECCVEFIRLVSSEANDVCEKSSKKTIAPEHVAQALKELGFDSYIAELEEVLKEHKVQQKDRERKMTRMEDSGLSAEELQKQQEQLFAASRARYEATQ